MDLGICIAPATGLKRKKRESEEERYSISSFSQDNCESCDGQHKTVQKREAKVETEEEILLRSYGSQLRFLRL